MATVRERGQLLLIGGLALAISLVTIALVLNSAIYTHNLASRYDSPGDEVLAANSEVADSVGSEIRYANDAHADQGYSDIRANYTNGTADIEATMAEEAAVDGHVLRVADAGNGVEGVRIVDEASGGSSFYPRYGTPNEWTLADQSRVRSFRIREASGLASLSTADAEDLLGLSDLTSLGGLTSAFVVVFDDGSTEYRVTLYDDTDLGGPTVMIHEDGTGAYRTCTTGSTPVRVDFTAGSFNGEPCASLGVLAGLSGPIEVRYYYGDEITGKYRFVADGNVDGTGIGAGPFTDRVDTANNGEHCSSPTYYSASSSRYPRISPAIYATEVETTYQSDRVEYQGTQRVAPAELRGEPQAPRVNSFTVTEPDPDTNDGEYTVSWSVEDPNGDSVTVTLEVTDIDDTKNPAISGQTGTTTVDLDDGQGPYTFTLTASDGPNTRTVTQNHAEDGGDTGCPA